MAVALAVLPGAVVGQVALPVKGGADARGLAVLPLAHKHRAVRRVVRDARALLFAVLYAPAVAQVALLVKEGDKLPGGALLPLGDVEDVVALPEGHPQAVLLVLFPRAGVAQAAVFVVVGPKALPLARAELPLVGGAAVGLFGAALAPGQALPQLPPVGGPVGGGEALRPDARHLPGRLEDFPVLRVLGLPGGGLLRRARLGRGLLGPFLLGSGGLPTGGCLLREGPFPGSCL